MKSGTCKFKVPHCQPENFDQKKEELKMISTSDTNLVKYILLEKSFGVVCQKKESKLRVSFPP
jgi:hypothetical protein